MTWPTDDLTKVHLDAGTDSPSNARAELEALVDKVKLMLAEVSTGATVWHSGNDGATSTLDADLLDGQEGSYYRNGSNINAGTVPVAYLPSGIGQGFSADYLDDQHGAYYLDLANHTGEVTAAQIGADQVGQSEIANSSVGQAELKLGTQTVTLVGTGTSNFLLTGAGYSLVPMMSVSTIFGVSQLNCDVSYDVCPSSTATSGMTSYNSIANFNFTCSGSTTGNVRFYFFQASPPNKIGELDYLDFIYLKVNKDGGLSSACVTSEPPWYYNGPTCIKPDRIEKNGKKYKNIRILPDNFESLPRHLKLIAKAKAQIVEVEVDCNFKNKDMAIYPHPFLGDVNKDQRVLIIEPDDKCYKDIVSLSEQGESIGELLSEGYLKIGEESKSHDCPTGVCMHKIKWTNLK